MDRKTVLQMAESCVCTDRNEQYGEPEDNFAIIAKYWEAYISNRCSLQKRTVKLDSGDVANMMMLFKIGRATTAIEQKADTFIDIAGYAACAAEIFVESSKKNKES